MNLAAIEELRDIISEPSYERRLQRLNAWRRQWVEVLYSRQLIGLEELEMMKNREGFMQWLDRKELHDLANTLAGNTGVVGLEEEVVDEEGKPVSMFDRFRRKCQQRTRLLVVLRQEARH